MRNARESEQKTAERAQDYQDGLDHAAYLECRLQAATVSASGCVQHVNRKLDGTYYVSDWFNSDSTVASFENGKER